MVALPKKVRDQARKAQKIHDQIYKQPESDAGTLPTDSGEPTPGAESRAQGSSEALTGEDNNAGRGTGVGSESINADTGNPDDVSAVIDAGTTKRDTELVAETADRDVEIHPWEHKYNVINGKYKAEVPRLHQEIKELRGQVGNMQLLVSKLEQAPVTPATPATPEAPAAKLLQDSEVEAYGADLIDVVKRAAREEMAPEVSRLEAENKQLREQVSSVNDVMVTNARQHVYNTLDEEMGSVNIDWRELNSDAGFLGWLGTVDAYTNTVRRDLLDQAFRDNDAARVVAFFKGYLNENAVVNTATTETPTPRTPVVDMASLAAPGKPKGGATPGTQEGNQTWRQGEIAAFYADVRRGKFKGNADEKAKLEKSIMDAVKNNRVVA